MMDMTPTRENVSSLTAAPCPHSIPTTIATSTDAARSHISGPLGDPAGLGLFVKVVGITRGLVMMRKPTCAVEASAEAGAREAG